MHTIARTFSALVILTALMLIGSGCTAESKKARHLQRADSHYDAGEYDQAVVEYLSALKLQPMNPRAIGRLGMIYSAQGRTGQAIAYIMKGHELLPDDLDLRLKLGQLYQATGKLEDARKEADFILTRKPSDPEAPSLFVATMANPNEEDTLRKRLLALPAPAPTGVPVLVALASLDLRLGHLPEADALLQKAKAADPAFAATYSVLGAAQLVQKNLPLALQYLQQAATLSPPRSPRILQYAQYNIRAGNLEAGKKILLDMTVKTPDYVPAWIALAEITLLDNKLPECTEMLAKALARDPQNVEALVLQGRLHNLKGEHDKAIRLFEKLSQSYPKLPTIYLELGRAYALSGDINKAITALTQAVTLAPNLPEAVLLLARLDNQKGDHNAAVSLLNKLLAQSPALASAQMQLADTYRAQGNLDGALAIYQQLEQKAPKNPQTPMLRGLVLAQQGKTEEARQAYEHAFELTPDSPAALEQLVNLLLKDKSFQPAVARVEAEITKNPKLGGVGQLLLAKIAMAQTDNTKAEIHLKKSIELMPDSEVAYFLLAGIYSRTNQQAKALTQLNEVIKRDPKQATALMLASVIQDQQGNYTAARDGYEKLLALNPQSAVALNNLAYLYSEKLNDPAKAQDLAQKARQLLPDDAHAADTLGWILYKNHQYPRALTLLHEAAEKRPTDAEIQFHLGLTRYMMGEEEEARATLQHAMQMGLEAKLQDTARDYLAILTIDTSRSGPEARSALDKALAERPDDPVALARLAQLFEKEGKSDQAISSLETAYKSNPLNVSVLVNLARLHSAARHSAKALEYAKAARKLAPDDGDVTLFLGRLALQNDDYQWAFSLLQEAARKKESSPDLMYDLALASYSVGRLSDAEIAMNKALSLIKAPGLTLFSHTDEARQFLTLLALAENPAEATKQAALVEQVLKADPASVPGLMVAAAICEQGNAPDAARQSYEKVLAQYPDFTPAKARIAILGSQQPAFDQQAYDYALQARTAFPTNPEIAKALGILSYRKGDHGRAVVLLKESLASLKDDSEAWFFIGQAQFELKNPAESKTALQRAVQMGLNGEQAKEAQRKLSELK